MSDPKIIVALDFAEAAAALALAAPAQSRALPTEGRQRVVYRGWSSAGGRASPIGIHHIPRSQVPRYSEHSCAGLQVGGCSGVWMLNVHALGGRAMMMAARQALKRITGASASHCSDGSYQHGLQRSGRSRHRGARRAKRRCDWRSSLPSAASTASFALHRKPRRCAGNVVRSFCS